MALKKLVLGLLIGLTKLRNVTCLQGFGNKQEQGCKLAIKCCRFAAFFVVLQLQNEIAHTQWFCHLYAFEHCDAERNKRKSKPRPDFVNASPKQMAQLTDFQHAPFNGTKK